MNELKLKTDAGEVLRLVKLPQSFYIREATVVAKELLGKIFVRKTNGGLLAARITETEAYDGRIDPAAHSFVGKTKRNETMFEKGGLLYVYFIYGMYYCSNVVTGEEGEGSAALLRAMEPLAGVKQMALNRYGKEDLTRKEFVSLLNGPGKLCMAFDLTKKENGANLCGDEIFIATEKEEKKFEITETSRIGIKKGTEFDWRFYIKDSEFISRK